ncbi:hypothetical protein [Hyphomicrobium sulfonivorans]|uniref:hypothetical protein n=1 Tax=Hyphomicrobium sulfonivorans TaxID=121290 RepID=UPI00156E98D5|nr:hypothetical protein [Hyphomicrobium sulfonivorans]MBI1650164.1 hypothetical protein [Hyphomicrobium sulfonivorans]NSL73080.1 hypothetical protein [Hyphomicrobium sulfonivorans]
MRSVLNLISLLAVGLIMAAIIMAAPADTTRGAELMQFFDRFDFAAPGLDYRSVLAGLALGVVIALIARISWVDIARRTAGWIANQAHRLLLLGLAAILIGVIIYV